MVWSEILKYTKYILKKLHWIGIATVEFKLDPRDNIPKLMEINPRFFGYTNLAISAGFNLPLILYDSFKNNFNQKSCLKKVYQMSFSRLIHDFYTLFHELILSNVNRSHSSMARYGIVGLGQPRL